MIQEKKGVEDSLPVRSDVVWHQFFFPISIAIGDRVMQILSQSKKKGRSLHTDKARHRKEVRENNATIENVSSSRLAHHRSNTQTACATKAAG